MLLLSIVRFIAKSKSYELDIEIQLCEPITLGRLQEFLF